MNLKLTFLAIVLFGCAAAQGQVTTLYSPAVSYAAPAAAYYSGPTVTSFGYGPVYNPPVGYYATGGRRAAYYAPAPAAAYYYPTPTAAYYAPAPTAAYYAPAPTVAYYAPAPAPVYVGRPAVVRTKVYYPGQPVRNTLRAVTP